MNTITVRAPRRAKTRSRFRARADCGGASGPTPGLRDSKISCARSRSAARAASRRRGARRARKSSRTSARSAAVGTRLHDETSDSRYGPQRSRLPATTRSRARASSAFRRGGAQRRGQEASSALDSSRFETKRDSRRATFPRPAHCVTSPGMPIAESHAVRAVRSDRNRAGAASHARAQSRERLQPHAAVAHRQVAASTSGGRDSARGTHARSRFHERQGVSSPSARPVRRARPMRQGCRAAWRRSSRGAGS